jgi:chromosome segregation ATPase
VKWLDRLLDRDGLAERNRELLKDLARARRDAEDEVRHYRDALYTVQTELGIAQNHIERLKTEREVMLRAITGIGPELLRRLADMTSAGAP